jgi:hypothetical protein
VSCCSRVASLLLSLHPRSSNLVPLSADSIFGTKKKSLNIVAILRPKHGAVVITKYWETNFKRSCDNSTWNTRNFNISPTQNISLRLKWIWLGLGINFVAVRRFDTRNCFNDIKTTWGSPCGQQYQHQHGTLFVSQPADVILFNERHVAFQVSFLFGKTGNGEVCGFT